MNRKIKGMMISKNVKQADIARDLKVSRGTVSGAIGGHHESEPVLQKTAELLGITYHELRKMWKRIPKRLKKAA